MKMVFNTEGQNEILGQYVGTDEGVVSYTTVYGAEPKHAPADCVAVREVTSLEMATEVNRLKLKVEAAVTWLGGDPLTAMNSVVAAGIELVEYAQIMGAALTVDGAYTELRRKVNSGDYYIGARAHSRALDEGVAASV